MCDRHSRESTTQTQCFRRPPVFLFFSEHCEQYHAPLGSSFKPTHSKWNHSIAQFLPSHPTMLPKDTLRQVQYLVVSAFETATATASSFITFSNLIGPISTSSASSVAFTVPLPARAAARAAARGVAGFGGIGSFRRVFSVDFVGTGGSGGRGGNGGLSACGSGCGSGAPGQRPSFFSCASNSISFSSRSAMTFTMESRASAARLIFLSENSFADACR